MRLVLALSLALLPVSVAAQDQSPAAELAPPPLEDQLNSAREQLLASQQRIAALEQLLADAQAAAAPVPGLQAKNAALVEIGRELIASYERRYRGSQWGPFQLARTRFERELQAMGDRVHDARADAVAAPEPAAEAE